MLHGSSDRASTPVSWLRRADRSSISSFHLADLGRKVNQRTNTNLSASHISSIGVLSGPKGDEPRLIVVARASTAQAMRASLLASAIASMLRARDAIKFGRCALSEGRAEQVSPANRLYVVGAWLDDVSVSRRSRLTAPNGSPGCGIARDRMKAERWTNSSKS